jgi:2-iminobutanoate/2-iminopropanoate deaminase
MKTAGPYSPAVRAGDFLFVSGQIPVDPATGDVVAGDTAAQTRRVLDNLELVLRAAGAKPADVVKTTIFLTDLADFGTVNSIYAERFPAPHPARATVGVAALPKGVKVEIEAVAHLEKR